MKKKVHKSLERGHSNNNWLESNHTFSFGSYHDSQMNGFGVLKVINDDIVAPSKGFDTHSHKNMEIISIPISGSLKHKDTLGNDFTITEEEIQLMSAGKGISHSEYNNSDTESVNFLQIWI